MPQEPTGQVVEINISPEHEVLPQPVERVRAVAGRGLQGEYHFYTGEGVQPERDQELTLIRVEAFDGPPAEHGIEPTAPKSRRNVATSGVGLNGLEGRRGRVGP